MNSQIRLVDCKMGYGTSVIVSVEEMKMDVGSIYCVFGRNGSGKTTMLKSMSGLIPSISGEIHIEGKDLIEVPLKELSKKLSIVLTGRPAVSNMHVIDFISFGRYPHNDWMGRMSEHDQALITKSIDTCQVRDYTNKLLDQLSDGEIQKVQISRALAQNTKILLLDEPAAHLDLVNKAEIFNLLKNIGSIGEKCIVFTSHDIQFALQLADHFIVIENGIAKKWTAKEFKNERVYERILKSDLLEINGDTNSIEFKTR
jgi:iron complex transport system ATP-binding protein